MNPEQTCFYHKDVPAEVCCESCGVHLCSHCAVKGYYDVKCTLCAGRRPLNSGGRLVSKLALAMALLSSVGSFWWFFCYTTEDEVLTILFLTGLTVALLSCAFGFLSLVREGENIYALTSIVLSLIVVIFHIYPSHILLLL